MAEPSPNRWSTAAIACALGVLAVVVVRCAWVGDDSFITLRTLEHGLSGHGLRYNVAERVQAYTHPLWLALLAVPYAVSRDPYGSALATSFVVTAAWVLALVLGVARSAWGAVLAVAVLVSSKAAVDYATSGLENPLTHLLLVAFALELWRDGPRGWVLVGLTSLLALSRPDAPLLVAPALVLALWQGGRSTWPRAALGLLPLVGWALLAFVYYGSVLPNTAYAKLGTGISDAELHAQGWHYLAWTLRTDPVTLPAIGAGLVAAAGSRDPRGIALMAGALAYVGYVWHIGGDFMGGRFFTAPLVLACVALARVSWPHPALPAGLGVATVLGSLLSPYAPLRSGPRYEKAPPAHGVVDERGYYWRGAGLWAPGDGPLPRHMFVRDGLAARGTPVKIKSVIGFYGYYAGPEHHVIDRLGLADPFLARLPAEFSTDWRIGHHRRTVPRGYADSVAPGAENRIRDDELAAFYDVVREVTRGPLLSGHRLATALRLQLGWIEPPRLPARYPGMTWVEGPNPVPRTIDPRGLGMELGGASGTLSVELGGATFTVLVERGDAVVQRLQTAGPTTLELDHADRVLLLPERPGTVSAARLEGAP